MMTDAGPLILVDDVFEVYEVQVIGPWMKDSETCVVHVLESESLDLALDKPIGSLERYHWVLKVILFNGSVARLQELRNSLNA